MLRSGTSLSGPFQSALGMQSVAVWSRPQCHSDSQWLIQKEVACYSMKLTPRKLFWGKYPLSLNHSKMEEPWASHQMHLIISCTSTVIPDWFKLGQFLTFHCRDISIVASPRSEEQELIPTAILIFLKMLMKLTHIVCGGWGGGLKSYVELQPSRWFFLKWKWD